MKYVYSVAIVFGLFVGSVGIAQASGAWEKLLSLTDQTVESKPFTVEAKGWNLRGYLFQVPGGDKTCLFVAGENKGGLDCWDSK